MSDNPRTSGHPSDIPSSRYKDSSSVSSDTRGPGDTPPTPTISSGSSSGSSHHTRNIIIGAIATIVASTTVYYLTQYVNKGKSNDSPPDHLVMKEATVNAWKRYVIIDNIYFKSVRMVVADDDKFDNNHQKFTKELLNESATFKKDAARIIDEKNVDPAFKTMLTRRIERQTEFEQSFTVIYNKILALLAAKKGNGNTIDLSHPDIVEYFNTTNRLYKKAATEIEDLAKTLTETYGTPFNASDVLMYTIYKEGVKVPGSGNGIDSTTVYSTNVDAKTLVGNWNDRGNAITLQANGQMKYSLNSGDKATGTWKIENDKLRVDAVSTITNIKRTWFFNLSKIEPNSFTMKLDESPYDKYDLARVK